MRETFVNVKSSKRSYSKSKEQRAPQANYLVSIADLVDMVERHAQHCPRMDIFLKEADQKRRTKYK